MKKQKHKYGKSKTNKQQEYKDKLRREAEERNAKWSSLSRDQKIVALDVRLGFGMGAKKQRAKLNAEPLRCTATEYNAKLISQIKETVGKVVVAGEELDKQAKKGKRNA